MLIQNKGMETRLQMLENENVQTIEDNGNDKELEEREFS